MPVYKTKSVFDHLAIHFTDGSTLNVELERIKMISIDREIDKQTATIVFDITGVNWASNPLELSPGWLHLSGKTK